MAKATIDKAVEPAPSAPQKFSPISWRAVLIGLAISPLMVYWAEYTEVVARGADLVAMSLILAVAFALVVIIGVNVLIKKIAPAISLSQSELLLIYVINSATFGLCGLGSMQFIPNLLAGPHYYTTSADGWNKWTHLIPAWAVPSPSVVGAYYRGQSNFFTPENISGWTVPIIIWSSAVLVMFFMTYCVGTLLRRQWVEKEKLLFPIVIIPLEITKNGGDSSVWKSKLFWGGFAIAVVVESLAAAHYSIAPTIPYLPIKPSENALNMGQHITTPPWNGTGTLLLAFYPMVIGLTYLLSLDVSFSCWFFYVLFKGEAIMAVAFGMRDPGASSTANRVPFAGEQSTGGFLGLAVMSFIFALPQLKRSFQYAFLKRNPLLEGDQDEPLTYRTAYVGLVASLAALVGFAMALGASLMAAVGFFLIFLVIMVALARIRAEAGIALNVGPQVTPTLVNYGGSSSFTHSDLLAVSMLQDFGSDPRAMSLPPQMEAMKISQSTNTNPRHVTAAIFAGAFIVVVASWISLLAIYYHYGAASANVDSWRTSWGYYPYTTLQSWIQTPKEADGPGLSAIAFGFVFTVFLAVMRSRFVWWPFHPIGYAFGGAGADDMWFPMFLGWVAKALSIRFGGIKTFRNALPFFIGLVIGDIVISAVWAIGYVITGSPGYRTFPV